MDTRKTRLRLRYGGRRLSVYYWIDRLFEDNTYHFMECDYRNIHLEAVGHTQQECERNMMARIREAGEKLKNQNA